MADDPNRRANSHLNWQPRALVVMCAVCLAMGFLAGYLLRGSGSTPAPTLSAGATTPTSPAAEPAVQAPIGQPSKKETPSLEDLKRMADKKAEPLLTKLKLDPKNSQLWN